MIFELLTIFPEFFRGPFEHGVVARARAAGVLDIRVHDLRNWTSDRHRTVDDRPFGGGEGMLLKPEPLFHAVESIWPERGADRSAFACGDGPEASIHGSGHGSLDREANRRVVLLSAQGRLFDQAMAAQFASLDGLLLICGRYEGVDERVAEHLADEEISIGDYVLSGGELAAAVVVDTVARLLPGVLGNKESAANESFSGSRQEGMLLDCPQYTRPAEFRGWKVPEVLLSGHHGEVRRWRERAALEKTRRLRPDLVARRGLVEFGAAGRQAQLLAPANGQEELAVNEAGKRES